MNEYPRLVVTVEMTKAMNRVLNSSGLMGVALTAGLTELRLLVRQATLTKHRDLPKLQEMLAAAEERNRKHPEPELGAMFLLPTE
jgi:hypothetical protein